MRSLYNLFIHSYNSAITIASVFNEKASLWKKGRANIFKNIEQALQKNERIIWFHCASLGEFEQGRPLIEKIKNEKPEFKIFLTFFSPSGYEIRKDYPFADYIFYLPTDTAKNAKRFVELLNPEIVIFVKYEFWFNYFTEIKNKDIPLYLISGVFREDQHFFKPWGSWQRNQLKNISYFFLQDDKSTKLLKKFGFNNVTTTGDTRLDRVSEILKEEVKFPIIENFAMGSKVLCAGSSWPPDEDIILHYLKSNNSNLKLIIAPHDISKSHIDEIRNKFQEYELAVYSETKEGDNLSEKKILIIDSIGLLNKIYRFTDIAYVGGGFGVAIHNLPEAAVYGIPVLYGPKHTNFREALEMSEQGGGFPVNNKEEFSQKINQLLQDGDYYKESAEAAANYIKRNTGSTELILKNIEL
jgi:3-deoxy-D-manno-octulosonic-acid transferase